MAITLMNPSPPPRKTVSFPDVDSRIEIPNFNLDGKTELSFETLLKHTSDEPGRQQVLWVEGNVLIEHADSHENEGWPAGRLRWNLEGDWRNHCSYTLPYLNDFFRLTVTLKNGYSQVWINGQVVGTMQDDHAIISTATAPCILGNRDTDPMTGEMTHVRFWDRELSVNEIVSGYRLGLTGRETDLLGYWPLNEGQGVTSKDCSLQGHDATLNNVSWNDYQ